MHRWACTKVMFVEEHRLKGLYPSPKSCIDGLWLMINLPHTPPLSTVCEKDALYLNFFSTLSRRVSYRALCLTDTEGKVLPDKNISDLVRVDNAISLNSSEEQASDRLEIKTP